MNKIKNCVWYDIKEGIFRMFPLYILEIIIIVLFTISAIFSIKLENSDAGVLELSIKIFEGIEEYTYVQGGKPFEIPMFYLTFSFMSGIFAAFYPKREWVLRGNMYISRYQSKNIWWISKCIWCMLQTFFIYFITFFTIWAVACINGESSISVRKFVAVCYKQPLLQNDTSLIFCYIYVLGFATTLALNQCLVLFQMIFSPIISYLFLIVVIVSSAYYNQPFMIGNNYMLLRTKVFCENGIDFKFGITIVFVLWMLMVLIGKLAIKNKDIL